MSPAAVERRLETVDELRALAIELSQAERLGAVRSHQRAAKESATDGKSESP
jgi:hypothetical protein